MIMIFRLILLKERADDLLDQTDDHADGGHNGEDDREVLHSG